MSFLDNPKNAGLAVWIVGIVEMILGLASIVTGVVSDDVDTVTGVVTGIGSIIVGFIYFGFGKSVRSGAISDKWDIACRFVLLTAVVTFINGIFGYNSDMGTWATGIVIGLIVAVIIYWIHTRMVAGGDNVINKILWIVLVVVLVISLISSIITVFAFPIGTIEGLCGIIISLFLIVTLLDADVRSKMGM